MFVNCFTFQFAFRQAMERTWTRSRTVAQYKQWCARSVISNPWNTTNAYELLHCSSYCMIRRKSSLKVSIYWVLHRLSILQSTYVKDYSYICRSIFSLDPVYYSRDSKSCIYLDLAVYSHSCRLFNFAESIDVFQTCGSSTYISQF